MNPNYDDLNDFFGIDPVLDEAVRDYLRLEWILDLDDYPHHIQEKALQMISDLKGNESVCNIAGKIAMEVIPL